MGNWLEVLDSETKIRATKLIEDFKGMGCPDPEGWARSEINENIAQLARYRFLRPLKNSLAAFINEPEKWIERDIKYSPEIGYVLKKMLDAGIQPDEIGRLARYIAGDSIHQILYRLDDPYDFDLINGGDNYPSWCLKELDKNGEPTGRQVSGLFESLYED